jgi:hypothetical protein
MPLSNVQKGAIGQFAFLMTALATGRGEVETYVPVADNERRDAEVRRHLRSLPGIMIQIKVAFAAKFYGADGKKYLRIVFSVRDKRLESDARFWYFFGLYDLSQLRLHDPCFLIPSEVFHRIGRDGRPSKGLHWFSITASLEPDSNDKWTSYRISPKDLGKRLLMAVDSLPLTASNKELSFPPNAIWLGRSARRSRRAAHKRAA